MDVLNSETVALFGDRYRRRLSFSGMISQTRSPFRSLTAPVIPMIAPNIVEAANYPSSLSHPQSPSDLYGAGFNAIIGLNVLQYDCGIDFVLGPTRRPGAGSFITPVPGREITIVPARLATLSDIGEPFSLYPWCKIQLRTLLSTTDNNGIDYGTSQYRLWRSIVGKRLLGIGRRYRVQ